jgi:hypothetical protein
MPDPVPRGSALTPESDLGDAGSALDKLSAAGKDSPRFIARETMKSSDARRIRDVVPGEQGMHLNHRSSRLFSVSLAIGFSIALAACASDDGGGKPSDMPAADAAPDARDPTLLYVAGQYPTAVTLTQSTCQGIQVESMTTTVTHAAGAADLSLRHAGITYLGTVERDGAFSTTPQSVGGAAETHRLTISGRFSTTGFEATVTAEVTRNASPACAYVVSWIGTKMGEPNVVPG